MATVVSQSLVEKFARWAMGNGGDIDSGVRLLTAAQNHSAIIKARLAALLKNSGMEFSEGLPERMADDFTPQDIQRLFSLPDGSDWEWVK